MFELEISFHSDDRLTVTSRLPALEDISPTLSAQTSYDHEDTFLKLVIEAALDEATTTSLIVAVLQAVGRRQISGPWISALMEEDQVRALGLKVPVCANLPSRANQVEAMPKLPLALLQNAQQFYDFLMNAPTPFVMLSGPEHVFTFVNPAYLQLLGHASSDRLIGLPARTALPEPGFDHCLAILQRAYDTGIPQVRKELLNSFRQEDTGLMVDAYFDIVYHPVRDASGSVSGIMAQATDVTERVLSRQASAGREQRLYSLWAELESIYAAVPVGISVIDPANLKVKRMNSHQAAFFGVPANSLIGSSLEKTGIVPLTLIDLLKAAARGETFTEIAMEFPGSSIAGNWLVSIVPSLDPRGRIDALTFVTLGTARQRAMGENQEASVLTSH